MSQSTKKSCAVIGMGNRGLGAFAKGIVGFPGKGIDAFRKAADLTAICDSNPQRAEVAKEELGKYAPDTQVYSDYRKMLRAHHFDVVVIATADFTHRDIAIDAMKLGADILCEKPMATTAADCTAMIRAQEKYKRKLRVSFNARYSPKSLAIKRFLDTGALGKLTQLDYREVLDDNHGADYFRRWHAQKSNSGGLLIHKASHHFDIINYYLQDEPESVAAFGGKLYYTPRKEMGERCLTCNYTATCRHYYDLAGVWNGLFKKMYIDGETHDGYVRDKCVYHKDIDIEDTASAAISYRHGAKVTYSLVAYGVKETQELAITGTEGRLTSDEETTEIRLKSGEKFNLKMETKTVGDHGGADVNILKSVLMDVDAVPAAKAGPRDGLLSVAIGDAANRSIAEGRVVKIKELCR